MRPPRGDSTQTRQSPSSSRTRSTTIVAASGHGAGGRHLIAQVLEQVLGGARVEIVLARQPIDRGGRRQPQQVVHQPADGEAELERPAGAVALPERHLAGLSRRRRHEHAVVRDLLDAPRRGAEDERLADAALEHHLFVELADARGARSGADEEDAVQAAIGNRAAVGDRHALGALARRDRAGDAVPRDARPQLGELVGRVAARQHVEHAVEHRAAQLGERRRAADRREQLVDVPVVHRRHRDDLLRDDVERVAGIAGGLDGAVVHRLGDGGARDEVAAELREDDALADGVGLMAAAADALQAARHRRRRFDLHDQVDGAHVDAELERRGGDQRAERAGLQQVLDLDALRPRDRARGASGRASRRPARSARRPAVRRGGGCSRRSASSGARESARAAAGGWPTRSTAASRRPTPGRSGCRRRSSASPCPRPGPRSSASAPSSRRRRRW